MSKQVNAWEFVEANYPKFEECPKIKRINLLRQMLTGGFKDNPGVVALFNEEYNVNSELYLGAETPECYFEQNHICYKYTGLAQFYKDYVDEIAHVQRDLEKLLLEAYVGAVEAHMEEQSKVLDGGWSEDDIRAQYEEDWGHEPSDEVVAEVRNNLEQNFDASIGINWDTISSAIYTAREDLGIQGEDQGDPDEEEDCLESDVEEICLK